MSWDFEIGQTYSRRRDIHARFGGQERGGIITPKGHDLVIIITGDDTRYNGIGDRVRPDGSMDYFGEGMSGNMKMLRGNLAIRDHVKDGKDLLLFREMRDALRFEGRYICEGYRHEQTFDEAQSVRNAIVFNLRPLGPSEKILKAAPEATTQLPLEGQGPLSEGGSRRRRARIKIGRIPSKVYGSVVRVFLSGRKRCLSFWRGIVSLMSTVMAGIVSRFERMKRVLANFFSSSSFWFTAIFIAVFLIVTALVLWAFLAIASPGELSWKMWSPIAARNGMKDWSSTSDMLAAVLGVPVALAGSVVAIYIAHRAYAISQSQADLETSIFIEGLCEKSADAFWGMSSALNGLDKAIQNMPMQAVKELIPALAHPELAGSIDGRTYAFSLGTGGCSDGRGREHESVGEFSRSFDECLETCADAVMSVLRDPISSNLWEQACEKNEAISTFRVPPEMWRTYGGEKDSVFDDQEADLKSFWRPGQLASGLRKPNGSRNRDPLFPVALWALQGRHDRDFLSRIVSGEPFPSVRPKPRKPQVMPKSWDRLLDDAVYRILVAGALSDTQYYSHAEQSRGVYDVMAYNAGAARLVFLILQFPDSDGQLTAMNRYLDRDMPVSDNARLVAGRAIRSKNIGSYISPHLVGAAKLILRDPKLLLMYVGQSSQEKQPEWLLSQLVWKRNEVGPIRSFVSELRGGRSIA